MSLPATSTQATSTQATSTQAILDIVLNRLALLFLPGAHDDLTAARLAASQMLGAYNVETPEELRLAAEIISFGLHALEALSQAADPDLSLNQILRLRGSAVSLSREAHKSQRKLDQLQRTRGANVQQQPAGAQPETPAPQPQPTPDRPKIDKAIGLIEAERQATGIDGKDKGKSWFQSSHKREMAERMTENLKKNQAEHTAQAAPLNGQATALNTVTASDPGARPAA